MADIKTWPDSQPIESPSPYHPPPADDLANNEVEGTADTLPDSPSSSLEAPKDPIHVDMGSTDNKDTQAYKMNEVVEDVDDDGKEEGCGRNADGVEVDDEPAQEIEHQVVESKEDASEEKGGEGKVGEGKEHHILDDLERRILTRADQDRLQYPNGKPRGRPRKNKAPAQDKTGQAKGRGKRTAAKDEGEKPKKTRAPRKPKACRTLDFDGAAGDQDQDTGREEQKEVGKVGKHAAASSKAKAKAKVTPEPKAKRKARSKKQADPEPEHLEAPNAASSSVEPNPAPPAPCAESSPTADPAPDAPKAKKPRVKHAPLPKFQHCKIECYWSRYAAALKFPTLDGKQTQVGKSLELMKRVHASVLFNV